MTGVLKAHKCGHKCVLAKHDAAALGLLASFSHLEKLHVATSRLHSGHKVFWAAEVGIACELHTLLATLWRNDGRMSDVSTKRDSAQHGRHFREVRATSSQRCAKNYVACTGVCQRIPSSHLLDCVLELLGIHGEKTVLRRVSRKDSDLRECITLR